MNKLAYWVRALRRGRIRRIRTIGSWLLGGLLHALIYDPQATEILVRLNRTGEELEGVVRAAREGKGLVPSLPQSEITNRQGHPALALGTRNAKTRRAHWGKQTELRKAP